MIEAVARLAAWDQSTSSGIRSVRKTLPEILGDVSSAEAFLPAR